MKKRRIMSRYMLVFFAMLLLNVHLVHAQQQTSEPVLSNLELGFNKTDIEYVKCNLNEPFAPDNLNFTATVDKSYTARMFVTPFLQEIHSGNSLKINGAFVKAGEKFSVEVKMGDNPVEIAVTSKDGKTNIYHLNISQTDMSAVYTSEVIGKGMWRIYDYGGFNSDENMYLVEGDQKAILFDAGMGKGDLAGYIKTLTSKPIEVAITHGHGDHIGQLNQFQESIVYMSEKDRDKLPKDMNLSKFKWVKEGNVIDLGERSFEVLELPTHTPGSLLFLDAADKVLVTSDAVGSGTMVWAFFVPFKDLSIYVSGLKHIEAKIKNLDGLTLFVGHHYQEKVPLTGINGKQLYTDMRILTEKVLMGEIIGNLAYSSRGTRVIDIRQAYYGLAGLWYNPR